MLNPEQGQRQSEDKSNAKSLSGAWGWRITIIRDPRFESANKIRILTQQEDIYEF